jgi:protein disulfide-isomerase-like protein
MAAARLWRLSVTGVCLLVVVSLVVNVRPAQGLFLPDLTPTGFQRYVENRSQDAIVAVKIYAPWCHHCQEMEDDWNIVGNMFADLSNVVVASINGDKHVKLRESLGVTGYPAIYFYDKGAEKPRDWKYSRNWGVIAMELKRMAQEAGGATAREMESVVIPQSPTLLAEYRARYARVNKHSPVIALNEETLSAVAFDRSRDVVLAVVKPGEKATSTFMSAFTEAAAAFAVAGHSPNEIVFAQVDASVYEKLRSTAPLPTLASMPTVIYLPRGLEKRTKIATLIGEASTAAKATAESIIDMVNEKTGTEITVGGELHPQAGRVPDLDRIVAACFTSAQFRRKYKSFDEAWAANFTGVEELIKEADQKLEDKVYEMVGDGRLSTVQGNFYLKTFEKLVDSSGKGLDEIVHMIGRYEHTLEEAKLKKTMQAMHLREFARMRNLLRAFEEHSEYLKQQAEKLAQQTKVLVAESVALDILDNKFQGDSQVRERFAERARELGEARRAALDAASRGEPYRARQVSVAQAITGIPDKHVWVIPKGSIIPNEVAFKVAERKLPDLVVVLGPASGDAVPLSLSFYSKHDKAAVDTPGPPMEPLGYTESATDLETVLRFLEQAMQPPAPSSVVELTDKTFVTVALDKSKTVMVAFVASWCGHCKRLKPEYQKAASMLGRKGLDPNKVVMATIDADQYEKIRDQYAIQGFPTIKLFHAGDNYVEDYQGGRSAAELLSYIQSKAAEDASGKRASKNREAKRTSSFVVELQPTELDALLERPDKAVLLMLYAPWCSACQRLKESYEKLAEYFAARRDDVVIARLDADKHAADIEQRIKIEHYPTFRFWRKGNADERAMDESLDELRYDVELTALRQFVEEHAGVAKPPSLMKRLKVVLAKGGNLLISGTEQLSLQTSKSWLLVTLSLSSVLLLYAAMRILPARTRKRTPQKLAKKSE